MALTTPHNFREVIKDALIIRLFKSQTKYWHAMLRTLAIDNALYHGRQEGKFGVHFRGKSWVIPLPHESASQYSILPLAPNRPIIVESMVRIADELDELNKEQYEAERFLSGLVLFPAPARIFQEILGNQLFGECESELKRHKKELSQYPWDSNAHQAIMTYAQANASILTDMNRRLIINLITRDQTRQ